MSSNIKVKRICQHCGNEFTARTTTTLYCSPRCNNLAYKAKIRANKVEQSNKQTQLVKTQPVEELKAKEFLTVREVARLLNCSVRSAYYYIENGTIKAVNLGQRITRVKRSEIDKLFEQPQQPVTPQPEQKQFEISECYTLAEVQSKYGISEKALHDIIKRNSIPKIKKGWFAYVPKTVIDTIFS
jgi:excisionase family DNA binding protein